MRVSLMRGSKYLINMYHVTNVSIVKNATNDIIRILSPEKGSLIDMYITSTFQGFVTRTRNSYCLTIHREEQC